MLFFFLGRTKIQISPFSIVVIIELSIKKKKKMKYHAQLDTSLTNKIIMSLVFFALTIQYIESRREAFVWLTLASVWTFYHVPRGLIDPHVSIILKLNPLSMFINKLNGTTEEVHLPAISVSFLAEMSDPKYAYPYPAQGTCSLPPN